MHASLNLNEPAFCGKASSDRYGSTTGYVCLVILAFSLPCIMAVVSQICDISIHKTVPILPNVSCLEANLVSNCRKKNSLTAYTTYLVIK